MYLNQCTDVLQGRVATANGLTSWVEGYPAGLRFPLQNGWGYRVLKRLGGKDLQTWRSILVALENCGHLGRDGVGRGVVGVRSESNGPVSLYTSVTRGPNAATALCELLDLTTVRNASCQDPDAACVSQVPFTVNVTGQETEGQGDRTLLALLINCILTLPTLGPSLRDINLAAAAQKEGEVTLLSKKATLQSIRSLDGFPASATPSSHQSHGRLASMAGLNELVNDVLDSAFGLHMSPDIHASALGALITVYSPWSVRERIWREVGELGLIQLLESRQLDQCLLSHIFVRETSLPVLSTIQTALSRLRAPEQDRLWTISMLGIHHLAAYLCPLNLIRTYRDSGQGCNEQEDKARIRFFKEMVRNRNLPDWVVCYVIQYANCILPEIVKLVAQEIARSESTQLSTGIPGHPTSTRVHLGEEIALKWRAFFQSYDSDCPKYQLDLVSFITVVTGSRDFPMEEKEQLRNLLYTGRSTIFLPYQGE